MADWQRLYETLRDAVILYAAALAAAGQRLDDESRPYVDNTDLDALWSDVLAAASDPEGSTES